ncbi:unnamed protein product, partial [Strongylus vulgaris]
KFEHKPVVIKVYGTSATYARGSPRYDAEIINEDITVIFANSRQCMKSTTLGNVQIEEGTFVMVDTLSLHYDPEIWGKDANEFRPDRWLESSRPVAAWIPFGLGPRQCIGMRLAQLEEKLVLAHLLRRFDIVATDTTEVNNKMLFAVLVSIRERHALTTP